VALIAVALLIVGGCGGTWVDDAGNFNRVFGFDKPSDVQVLHSYYWKSPHWTTEYRYFIAVRGPAKFANGLTAPQFWDPATPDKRSLETCGGDPPAWFMSKPLDRYKMWMPKDSKTYRVFQDKDDLTFYACDEQL